MDDVRRSNRSSTSSHFLDEELDVVVTGRSADRPGNPPKTGDDVSGYYGYPDGNSSYPDGYSNYPGDISSLSEEFDVAPESNLDDFSEIDGIFARTVADSDRTGNTTARTTVASGRTTASAGSTVKNSNGTGRTSATSGGTRRTASASGGSERTTSGSTGTAGSNGKKTGTGTNQGRTASSTAATSRTARTGSGTGKTYSSPEKTVSTNVRTTNSTAGTNQGRTANSTVRTETNPRRTANGTVRTETNQGRTASSTAGTETTQGRPANSATRTGTNQGRPANSAAGTRAAGTRAAGTDYAPARNVSGTDTSGARRNASGEDRSGSSRNGGSSGRPPQKNNQQPSRRKKKKTSGGKIATVIFTIFLLLGVAGVFGGLKFFEMKTGVTLFQCIREGKAIAAGSTEADFTHNGKTILYASDGTILAELSEDIEGSYLTYNQIPENVVNAFVAIEDRTFWTNSGVDLKGIARVLWTYIKTGGETATGASTITQQLVKLTYLSAEKTLSRKVKEIVISTEITKKYRKEQIMEYYCNVCCFANGIYGIEDAARAYFGVSVENLTLSQTAYLCAIPNWPEYYNPKTNPDNALARRDKILGDMLKAGYITQAEYNEAINETIKIASNVGDDEDDEVEAKNSIYNYETTYTVYCAVRYLMAQNDFEFRYEFDSMEDYAAYKETYSEAYTAAKHSLYTGNYKIYTSLDLDAQKQMQAIVDSNLSDFSSRTEEGIYQVQGAMTVIDNETGKVVCIIGGRSQSELNGIYSLNRGFQGFFQPGSSIKPIAVYAPALDTGDYTTTSELTNIDVERAKTMSVTDITKMSGQSIVFRNAVERSINGCAYWLFSKIGISTGLSYLHEMNFSRILPEDYNVGASLGGLYYGVSTEEMANAYATLANDGKFTDADCLVSILDRAGIECYQQSESRQVYKEETATAITDVMKGVLTNGTASGSYWYNSTKTEAAGKTGTTNDNKAGWFCGYTPYYSIAVWVGCDTPTTVSGLSGASYPLSIWKSAMLYLIKDKPAAYFGDYHEEPVPTETEEETCTCIYLCNEDEVDSNCPVCQKDITNCEGNECTCWIHCSDDTINEYCLVCLQDETLCRGCTCTERCTYDHIDVECPLCGKGDNITSIITFCQGPEPEEDVIVPDEPEHPSEGDSPGTGGDDNPGGNTGGNTGGDTGGGTYDNPGGNTGGDTGGNTGTDDDKADDGEGNNPDDDEPGTISVDEGDEVKPEE